MKTIAHHFMCSNPLVFFTCILAVAFPMAAATPPQVLRSHPAHEASEVAPDVGHIVIHFDRNMRTGSHSLLEVAGHPFPPMISTEEMWQDPTTFKIPLKPLPPGKTYALQLNSERRKGFVSAEDGIPLPPTRIIFTVAQLVGTHPVATAPAPAAKQNPLVNKASSRTVKPHETLTLRRQWEPTQKAFSVLVPTGWQLEGGLFYVDPTRAGGAGNSIDTKCDLSVKRDAGGSVVARWLPSYNFADFSASPEFVTMAQLFPVGRVYNGCEVKPWPRVEAFLLDALKYAHPQATGIRVLQKIDLPELVEICQQLTRPVNQQLTMMGKGPMRFTAGALIVEYTENGVLYREALATALSDLRSAAAMWSNQFSFLMRAPAGEAEQWKPILDIIRQSIQFNPEWVRAYIQKSGERGQIAADTFRYLARIDQEIFERRSKQRSEIQHENYLSLTSQEEYVNPFTKEVERDSADYKYRWTTSGGDRLYTDVETFDPNRQDQLNQTEWKRTMVRPR